MGKEGVVKRGSRKEEGKKEGGGMWGEEGGGGRSGEKWEVEEG